MTLEIEKRNTVSTETVLRVCQGLGDPDMQASPTLRRSISTARSLACPEIVVKEGGRSVSRVEGSRRDLTWVTQGRADSGHTLNAGASRQAGAPVRHQRAWRRALLRPGGVGSRPDLYLICPRPGRYSSARADPRRWRCGGVVATALKAKAQGQERAGGRVVSCTDALFNGKGRRTKAESSSARDEVSWNVGITRVTLRTGTRCRHLFSLSVPARSREPDVMVQLGREPDVMEQLGRVMGASMLTAIICAGCQTSWRGQKLNLRRPKWRCSNGDE